jgi:hypothetical protein
MPNHTTERIYRCQPLTRNRDWDGGHVARQVGPVEDFIQKLVIARLSRDDAADLVAIPEGGPDVGALREEAAAIRTNLEEMAADRALGLITRAQMLAATERANLRLGEIESELEHAAPGERARPAGRGRERSGGLGGPGPVPPAGRDQDADDDHATVPGQGRAAGIRPRYGPGDLAAAR